MNELLGNARKYLVEFLQGKQHRFEATHPWRKDWRFVVLHALRVEAYVIKILNHERHDLSEIEINMLRLAAILHDIGRLEETEDHARLGAEITDEWLSKNKNHELTEIEKEKILEMIRDHSDKETSESNFSKAVLKDADTLDEIGVMSVFMSSNWIDRKSPFFFHDLRERLKEFEIPFCEEKNDILNTMGAREILSEKKGFIENFIAQLDDELESDKHSEQILRSFENERYPA